MGLFRDLGRRAEKLKSQATAAANEQADYECADCGNAIFTECETCPACGSDAVVERELPDGEPTAGETATEARPEGADDTPEET